MKRVIKAFANCSDELLLTIAEKYPNGFKDRHFAFFNTADGKRIKVLEMATEDTLYLIKFENYSVADLKDIEDVEKWINTLTEDDEDDEDLDADGVEPEDEDSIDALGEEFQ